MATITLTVNGKPLTLDRETLTVRELIEQVGLAQSAVAVEVNRQLIPKRQHDQTTLATGDTVELVTLVGGG